MKHYNFKLYEEIDIDLIEWLDHFTRKGRSEEIRRALRSYQREELTNEFKRPIKGVR